MKMTPCSYFPAKHKKFAESEPEAGQRDAPQVPDFIEKNADRGGRIDLDQPRLWHMTLEFFLVLIGRDPQDEADERRSGAGVRRKAGARHIAAPCSSG
jgi:hypothetical protein